MRKLIIRVLGLNYGRKREKIIDGYMKEKTATFMAVNKD
jgi:hypothetical protein